MRPRGDGVPSGVMLPTYLHNGYGFRGQHAGVLGSKFDPWHVKQDPNPADFRVEALSLPPGLTARSSRRPPFTAGGSRPPGDTLNRAAASGWNGLQGKAASMLTSGRSSAPSPSTTKIRNSAIVTAAGRLGSRSCSRRLIQSGVPIVQANTGSMNNRDTLSDNCNQLKTRLLPPLDQGVSALIDSPLDIGTAGRDSGGDGGWVRAYAPNRPGQSGTSPTSHRSRPLGRRVLGVVRRRGSGRRSSRRPLRQAGRYPASQAYYPSDLGATITACSGSIRPPRSPIFSAVPSS